MSPKYTMEEHIETWLAREIQEEINREIIESISNPNHASALTPMVFDSNEDKEAFKTEFDKIVNRDID
jgi:hypothetical protein